MKKTKNKKEKFGVWQKQKALYNAVDSNEQNFQRFMNQRREDKKSEKLANTARFTFSIAHITWE